MPAAKTNSPEIAVLYPLSLPRLVLGIVLPITSFDEIELKPLDKLKRISNKIISHPAVIPLKERETNPILKIAPNCKTEPITQTHFLIGFFLI